MLRIATVFSGIGAIEFALKRMNIPHEIVFACDNGGINLELDEDKIKNKINQLQTINDKKEYIDQLYTLTRRKNFVKQSFLANYDLNENRFFQDVRFLDGNDFRGKVDLFVGGSPCQSFSIIGEQQGLVDKRGNLFYDYVRLVNEIKPKIFIYENVRGLYTHDKKRTWQIIKSEFEAMEDYHISHQILNAVDYGIPQNRSRLFVVGTLKNIPKFEFPLPTPSQFSLNDFREENCAFGYFLPKNGKIEIKKNRGQIDSKYILSDAVQKYVMSSGTKGFYQKPEIDLKIARPLLSTMGNRHRAGIDNYFSMPNNRVRMLSEREAHRLMGFTDDFKIVVSRAQAYKQAGNSIVVDIFIALINQMLNLRIIKNK